MEVMVIDMLCIYKSEGIINLDLFPTGYIILHYLKYNAGD
jgi:hypothetical protein